MRALVTALSLLALAPPTAERVASRVSLSLKDAEITRIVALIARLGGFQAVVDPGVSCQLTLELKQAAWDVALDATLRACRLGYEESGGIVRVATLARLAAERADERTLADEQALRRPVGTVLHTLSHARAAELAPLLESLLSPRGKVVVDARTNTLIVTDASP